MKQHITRKNIGLVAAILLTLSLGIGIYGKISGAPAAKAMLGNIADWSLLIGLGELVSGILFIIPRTYKLGTVLLSAYFGGAIMFHMSHPIEEKTAFTAGAVYLVLVWVISWVRGNELIDFRKK